MTARPIIIIAAILLASCFASAAGYKSYIIKYKKGESKKKSAEVMASVSVEIEPLLKLEPAEVQKTKTKSKKIVVPDTPFKNSGNAFDSYFVANFEEELSAESFSELENSPEIEFIEPNYIFNIEQDETSGGDTRLANQWGLQAVQALPAWGIASGRGVIVGVIDTGIDFGHQDLSGQLHLNTPEDINGNGRLDPWPSGDTIDGLTGDLNGIDDDGNGYTDDVSGYDFVDQFTANAGDYLNPDPVPADEHRHGTLVSGVIAAARGNDFGIAGMAYGAKIMPLRAFDLTGNAETDDIANAIIYAAENGAKVLNFSFGESVASQLMRDAIKYAYSKGCVMFASSGNNGWSYPHYPSGYEEVISVGAVNQNLKRDFKSNWGSQLNITAPGINILTTTLGGSFAEASGTSLAAPHAAALGAMLLEKEPSLTPADIKGIIMATARDKGASGWDVKYGSGIINALNALENIGRTDITISSPANESIIKKSEINELPLKGSVITPLFESYVIRLAEGAVISSSDDLEWAVLSTPEYGQKKNEMLYSLDLNGLKDTSYTISLLVNLKNGNTIEERIAFDLFSPGTGLKFVTIKAGDAWRNGAMEFLISAVTNYRANFSVAIRKKGDGNIIRKYSETNYLDNFHTALLGPEIPSNIELEAQLEAFIEGADTITRVIDFVKSGAYAPNDRMALKEYRGPISYVVNGVADFYGDKLPSFPVVDITGGYWRSTMMYSYSQQGLVLRDSIPEIWIPVDIGETNGDGDPEFLAKVSGKSAIFQRNQAGSVLNNKIFESLNLQTFWASEFHDFNLDGQDDVVGYSDTAFHVYRHDGIGYVHLATALLPDQHKYIGTLPASVSGNFDGDAAQEIAISTERGNLFIYEYEGNAFVLEDSLVEDISRSGQFMAAPDIDNDGIAEILVGNFGSKKLFDINNAGIPIWTFYLMKSSGPGKWEKIWEEQFYGVRANFEVKNGAAAGNVDNEPGDEIVISVFPNLYVFKWNEDEADFEPLWNYPNAIANSAIIFDFDGNGINELGFSTWGGLRFFEFSQDYTGPATPTGFDGWAVAEDSIYLRWEASAGAAEYEIIRIFADFTGESLGFTDGSEITLGGFQPARYYDIAVRAIGQDATSEITYPLSIYTHKLIYNASAEQDGAKRALLRFSGKIAGRYLNAGDFSLVKGEMEIFPLTAIAAGDSAIILTFADTIPPGEYEARSASFRDFYRSPTIPGTTALPIEALPAGEQELYLKNVDVVSKTMIALRYSEPVEETGAESIANYTFRPGGNVVSAERGEEDKSLVYLELGPSYPIGSLGKDYSVTVSSVVSIGGNKMTKGAGRTIGFVFHESALDDIFVYPNPIKMAEGPEIYFANLTKNAKVIITTLNGELVRELEETDGNGGVYWDGLDDGGNQLEGGVYLFKAETTGSNSEIIESGLKKMMIIR